MKQDIGPFLIPVETTILQAMRRLEDTREKVLFVVAEDRRLAGSLTDGDIRRWILAGGDIRGNIGPVCNPTPHTVGKTYRKTSVKRLMLESGIEGIPVLDCKGRILDVLFWKGLFSENHHPRVRTTMDARVVIMAGGKGSRLAPFTSILPKPLIPIQGKAILELIIDRFREFGCGRFLVSVQHKARMIKAYFEELAPEYEVEFLEEKFPQGTAGALEQLRDRLDEPFFVTNCDILIEADYGEILSHHKAHGNALTVVACLKRYTIPYGICQVEEGGALAGIEEKPEYGYLVNTGMYVLSPEVLDLLVPGEFTHMTDLIERARLLGIKVGVFPISENCWLDTGEWTEYRKTLQLFGAEAA